MHANPEGPAEAAIALRSREPERIVGPGSGERIAIVSASVGAGHDGAASELARRLTVAGFRVDRIDCLDLLPGRLGRLLREAYAVQLRVAPASWGWLHTALGRRGAMAALGTKLAHLAAAGLDATLGSDVRAVVSTYPMASQALGLLRRCGSLAAPTVTYLTDLSVHPLWISPDVDVHLTLHPITAAQAATLGARGTVVVAPAVRSEFHSARRCVAPGSDRALPLALVVAGSWGVGALHAAADDLAATGLVNPVVMCGRNEGLVRRLRAAGIDALGWTGDMPTVLSSCDLVVQNAGGLTAFEALAAGVPVISYRCLPGHGLDASRVMAEAGLAPLVSGRAELGPTLCTALDGAVAGRRRRAGRVVFDGLDPAAVIADQASTPVATRDGVRAAQAAMSRVAR